MKVSQDKQRVIYEKYQEYLAQQSLRKNVLKEVRPVFDPNEHPWIVEDLEILYKFIKPHNKILDVGCRSGWSCLRMIHDGYPNVIEIDVQAENIEFGLAWGAPIELGDAHHLKYYDADFDVVFIRSALEHMFDPRKVIEAAHRLLKNRGLIFINVPLEPAGINDISMAHAFAFTTKSTLLEMLSAFSRMVINLNIWVKSKTGLDMAVIRASFTGRVVSLGVQIHPKKLNRVLRLRKLKQYVRRILA